MHYNAEHLQKMVRRSSMDNKIWPLATQYFAQKHCPSYPFIQMCRHAITSWGTWQHWFVFFNPPPSPAPERVKKYNLWYKILDGFFLLYWTKILPVLESFNVSEEFSTILACLCDLKPKAEPVCKSISVTKWPSIDNSVADTLATCQIEPLGVQRVQKGLKSQADILVGRTAYPQSTRRVLGLEGRRYTSRRPLLIPVRRSNFTPNKEA